MVDFHSRFDPAEILNKNKVFDRHDDVDRLSYVDNSVMIKRLIAAGKNLMQIRAQTLRSGLYSGDLKEISQDDGIAIPVFGVDPAIADSIIKTYAKKMSKPSEAAQDKTTNSNDDKSGAASVGSNDSSSVNG